MTILGISCHYHDSAACIIRDGKILAAAEEERFNRQKHSSVFPREAVNFCIQHAGITFSEITHIAFYEKPFLKFARSILDHLEEFPFSLPHFVRTVPHWLGERLLIPDYLRDELAIEAPVYFVPHHLSHSAYAYFLSGYTEASLLTLDGVGETTTGSRGIGRGREIHLEESLPYPHSFGMFYSAIAEHLGFGAIAGEGKLMGLAAFGEPKFLREMEMILSIDENGGCRINLDYFSFRRGMRMGSKRLGNLLGKSRLANEEITQTHKNLASSAQKHLERAFLLNARILQSRHGTQNLCLAGGVALNCLANGRLKKESGFKNVFVPPGCGDSGGALGAALYLGSILDQTADMKIHHSYWGPSFTDREVEREARSSGFVWKKTESQKELLLAASSSLTESKVLGWFQGAMEFGPRALGNRSILALPRDSSMQDRVNRIKRREKFRPFAPMVPQDRAPEFFELDGCSPYMLFAVNVRENARAMLRAVTHVDGTARVQTVNQQSNPILHELLTVIGELTGVPVLLNTSFNLEDEPIVCRPADAFRTFARSELDELFIGRYIVSRKKNL